MVRRLCRSEDFAKRASTDVKEDMAPLGRNHYSSLEDQQACNASALPWSTLQHGAGGGAGLGLATEGEAEAEEEGDMSGCGFGGDGCAWLDCGCCF